MVRAVNSQTEQKIHATATVAYTEITNLAEDLTLPEGEYPLAQIIESLDDRICPLCEWLNGKIIRRGTQEWEQYRLPSHINCRRTFAYIPADADEEPDFTSPPQDIINKYGHFHTDPLKYEELKLPAYADRRQFIFSRYSDPDTGKRFSVLRWLIDYEDAIRQYTQDATLRKLFEIASIQHPLPKLRTPRNAQEFADAYQRYQQSYKAIYESIASRLEEIQHLKQGADARTTGTLIIQEFRIRELTQKLVQREIRDLQTIFRAPRPVRKVKYQLVGAYTQEQVAMLEEVIREARMYIPSGHRATTVTVEINPSLSRSHYFKGKIVLAADFLEAERDTKVETFVHEYMHFLEDIDDQLRLKISRIYQEQTQGEKHVSLRDILGNSYEQGEMAKLDDFPHAYMGKDYGTDERGLQTATEISSMFYTIYFRKLWFVKNYRLRELQAIGGPDIPREREQEDVWLDRLFEPSRLKAITLPLWRALHNRP